MPSSSTGKPIKLAVLTGGHCFDVPAFHAVFKSFTDIDSYIQTVGDFSMSTPEIRRSYDVVLFYHMLMDGPVDEGQWYESGQKKAMEELLKGNQGLFVLHHAILAWPKWELWNQLVGIANRTFDYHIGETVNIHVANPNHPITAGMKDFTMPDETYTMANAGPDSHVLLTTDHPKSMKTIAWTRQQESPRVFCLQSGHDAQTFVDENFRHIVQRGIRWCAGRS